MLRTISGDLPCQATSLLQSLGHKPFEPFPFIANGWGQTIGGHVWPRLPGRRPSARYEISLPDGDRLIATENRPKSWREGNRIALLVHGLAGSEHSSYMVRLSRALFDEGLLVLRLNLRGCGPGFGLARRPYHCGRSEDTREVLRWLERRFPRSPVAQIGFSLGANITLKMAGEDAESPSGNLEQIVAVSPPIDLEASSRHLREGSNRFFEKFFTWQVAQHISRLHRKFDDLQPYSFPTPLALRQIDDLYTAPRGGFLDAADYYARASAGPLISKITVPSLILYSKDDPVVDKQAFLSLPNQPNIDLVLTEKGGHVGFLGNAIAHQEMRWMDSLIVKWVRRNS